jgi:hypothetical protein
MPVRYRAAPLLRTPGVARTAPTPMPPGTGAITLITAFTLRRSVGGPSDGTNDDSKGGRRAASVTREDGDSVCGIREDSRQKIREPLALCPIRAGRVSARLDNLHGPPVTKNERSDHEVNQVTVSEWER